jgi:hypothetical protein
VAARVATLAAESRSPRPAGLLSGSVSPYLPLESRARSCQGVSRDLLVHMHSLRMLPKIVKPRETPRAMTCEGALASVFPANE